jgi:hypothetical protein
MKTCHFQRKNTNFLDANASARQNEGVEQAIQDMEAAWQI